jgi:integrase
VRYGGKTTYAGDSLQIAKEIELKIRRDKRLGRIDEYNKPAELTFREFVRNYYEPHYSGKKSAQSIKTKVDYFMQIFRDRPLRSIRPAEIEQAVSIRTVDRSPRTRDYYLAIIRRIFNYAIELEIIERSPVKMKELKVDNTRHRYLKNIEVASLLQACKNNRAKHLYPMVMIALHTGMRVGEIRTLKKASIVDGMIYIKSTNTKNNRSKIIPLTKPLKELLDEYDEFNFNYECKGAFKSALRETGIEDFRFHDLRHTFASKLKANNVNDSIIQKLLGHLTPHMVQRYAHLSPDSVLNAIMEVKYV